MSGDKIVTYEDMKKFEKSDQVLIIDVRREEEIKSTGKIGGSINIPIDNLENDLEVLSEEVFKEKYGRCKPSKDTSLIFTCLMGGRASRGADIAEKLGYKNAKFYKGSWQEWESKLGK